MSEEALDWFDYSKIEADLIKKIVKNNAGKLRYEIIDGRVWITLDGYTAFCIPKDKFYIDVAGFDKTDLFSKIMYKVEHEYDDAPYCTEIRDSAQHGLVRKFETDLRKDYVWVSEKDLKPFGKDCNLMICGNRQTVLVKVNGFAVGMISPINITR